MYPILFTWGDVQVPTWHVFFFIAAMTAFLLLHKLRRRFLPAWQETSCTNLFVACYVAAYLGARLFAIFVEERELVGPLDLATRTVSLGAMTFYGGLLGAVVVGTLVVHLRRLPFWQILDLTVVAGILGIAIGRIGCFLNGDDYGIVVSSPTWWSVTFPNHPEPLPRVPVQLLESLGCALIGGLGLWQFRPLVSRVGPGAVGCLGLASYGVLRFGDEFLRGDERGPLLGSLSVSQIVSLIVIVGCVTALRKRTINAPGGPADGKSLVGINSH